MNKLTNKINDILHIFRLRVNMIFRSLPVIIVFCVSIIITLIVVNSFLDEAEERTSIPIGVIDLDETEKSQNMVDNLIELNSVYVIEGNYDELCKKMQEGDIYVIVQINKGFEEILNNSKKEKLLTMYYPKGKKNIVMIADIVLSQVIDEICYNACYKAYSNYDYENSLSEPEYREYSDYIHNKYDNLLEFNYEIVNIENDKDVTDNITNGLLYRLVLIGIITVLISFITLFASNSVIMDKSYSTDKRLDISLVDNFCKKTGDLLALFFSGELYVIFAAVIIFKRLMLVSLKQIIVVFFSLTLFALLISIILMIIIQFIKEPVMLQIIGALVVCLCGITGAIEIISVVVSPQIRFIANFSPNVHIVRIYNKLIVLGLTTNELLHFIRYTLIMTIVFYIIIFVGNFIKTRKISTH